MRFKPFWLIESSGFSRFGHQLCLGEFDQLEGLFGLHQIQPDGCSWEAVARVMLLDVHPHLLERVHFASDARLFCVHSNDCQGLETLAACLLNLMQNELHLSRMLDHPHFALLEFQVRSLGREQTDEWLARGQ